MRSLNPLMVLENHVRSFSLRSPVFACFCRNRRISCNACGSRHCPKCQDKERARSLAADQAMLLPVPSSPLVLTLPHAVNPLARTDRRWPDAPFFQVSAPCSCPSPPSGGGLTVGGTGVGKRREAAEGIGGKASAGWVDPYGEPGRGIGEGQGGEGRLRGVCERAPQVVRRAGYVLPRDARANRDDLPVGENSGPRAVNGNLRMYCAPIGERLLVKVRKSWPKGQRDLTILSENRDPSVPRPRRGTQRKRTGAPVDRHH